MRYAYFPGCSAESTARDMHASTTAVARALGIELVEPKGWTCCGATAGHQTDRFLAAALPAASLAKVRDLGLDMVVSCAACYNRMRVANHEISANSDLRAGVSEALGRDYDGSVKVRHFLEVLLGDVGTETLKGSVKRSLNGLPVACYYGCLLVRPPEVTGFDDPENPTSMDRLVTALGGRALDWPHKVECCGGGLSMSSWRRSRLIWHMGQATAMHRAPAACAMPRMDSVRLTTTSVLDIESPPPQHSTLCGQSRALPPRAVTNRSMEVGFSGSSNPVTSGGRTSRQP